MKKELFQIEPKGSKVQENFDIISARSNNSLVVPQFDEVKILESINSDLDDPEELSMNINFQNYEGVIKDYIKGVKSEPMTKYEKSLYLITKNYFKYNPGKIRIDDLVLAYPLIDHANFFEGFQDSECIQRQLHKNSEKDFFLSKKFELIKKLVELISALSVKWGIFKAHKYSFRYNHRSQCSKFLDLQRMNTTCYNVETLWFCTSIKKGLLNELSNTTLKQFSEILADQTNQIFEKLLILEWANPKDLLSQKSKCPFTKSKPNIDCSKTYIDLKIPNLFCRLFCRKNLEFSSKLKSLISDFESCYRGFERELIGRFITLAQ